MAFCAKCGHSVTDEMRFCGNCGAAIEAGDTQNQAASEQSVRRCPICGGALRSLEVCCPYCGAEVAMRQASGAVKELTEKLERTESEKKKIIIIKNFPIPNTREDIFEFMMLASSNFNAELHVKKSGVEDITDAWLVKIEQCYNKAHIAFNDDRDLESIERIYSKIKADVEAHKKSVLEREEARAKKRKRDNLISLIVWLSILVTVTAIVATYFISGGFNFESDAVRVGYSDDDLEGHHYEQVVEYLKNKGFVSIETRSAGSGWFADYGEVKKVYIDGDDSFFSFERFSKDAKIIVFYYE